MNISAPVTATVPAANPFAAAVQSYTQAASQFVAGQDYRPSMDSFKAGNSQMAQGVNLLLGAGAPADLVSHVRTGLTQGEWLVAQADLYVLLGNKVSADVAEISSPIVANVLKSAQEGASFVSKPAAA